MNYEWFPQFFKRLSKTAFTLTEICPLLNMGVILFLPLCNYNLSVNDISGKALNFFLPPKSSVLKILLNNIRSGQ